MALVKRYLLPLLLFAASGLFLSACGGQEGLAPVTKHTQGKRWAPTVHKVRRGDTLYSIAFQYGKDFRTLARWNGIRAPYTIYVGQDLRLKPGKKVAVRAHPQPKKVPVKKKISRKTQKKLPNKLKQKQKTIQKTPVKQPGKGLVKGRVRWHWPSNGMIIKKFSTRSATSKGIDLSGRLGQAVKATAGGRVVYSGSGLRGYGRLIIVKHNEDFLSAYAHNRKLLVKEGEVVKQGQKIAEMGRSGTDRVKLHFEIRKDGNPVDPLRYLPKRRG